MLLIIGYGNPLRSDDGIGQYIAHHFDGRLYGEKVQILSCCQLMPELVAPISQANTVIFVDASRVGQPGSIRCFEIASQSVGRVFTHNFTPVGLLKMAYELYGVETRGFIVSVTGYSFSFGEMLSPQLEAAVPEVLKRLYQLVESELANKARNIEQMELMR